MVGGCVPAFLGTLETSISCMKEISPSLIEIWGEEDFWGSSVDVSLKWSKVLTLFHAGGHICPPNTFWQFSPDVLIRGGFNYTLNSSFVITEHLKLISVKKNFPTARGMLPKSAG